MSASIGLVWVLFVETPNLNPLSAFAGCCKAPKLNPLFDAGGNDEDPSTVPNLKPEVVMLELPKFLNEKISSLILGSRGASLNTHLEGSVVDLTEDSGFGVSQQTHFNLSGLFGTMQVL